MVTETARVRVTPPALASTLRGRDIALAVGVGAIQVVGTFAAAAHHGHTPEVWNPLALLLLVAGPVALLFRRTHPVAVLAVAWGAAVAYWIVGFGRGPLFLALIVALIN